MALGRAGIAAEANYLNRSAHSSFGSLELLDARWPKLRCVPTMAARPPRVRAHPARSCENSLQRGEKKGLNQTCGAEDPGTGSFAGSKISMPK